MSWMSWNYKFGRPFDVYHNCMGSLLELSKDFGRWVSNKYINFALVTKSCPFGVKGHEFLQCQLIAVGHLSDKGDPKCLLLAWNWSFRIEFKDVFMMNYSFYPKSSFQERFRIRKINRTVIFLFYTYNIWTCKQEIKFKLIFTSW